MRTLFFSALLFSMLAVTGLAAAQDRPNNSTPAPDQEFTFTDHGVEGGIQRPDGVQVFGGTRRRRTSLIRPRLHFVYELHKSVERL